MTYQIDPTNPLRSDELTRIEEKRALIAGIEDGVQLLIEEEERVRSRMAEAHMQIQSLRDEISKIVASHLIEM